MRLLFSAGVSASALVAFASSALAQTAECRPWGDFHDISGVPWEHMTTELRRDYQISTTNLEDLGGVTDVGVIRAVGLAASIWNEQGGGRPLRYAGTTTATDLPRDLALCPSNVRSLVIVDPEPDADGAKASIDGRCYKAIDSDGDGATDYYIAHAFLIRLHVTDENLDPVAWFSAGATIGANQHDLVSAAVHEFGHSFNVMHHSSVDAGEDEAQFSVMGYGTNGTTRRRDLYWRDILCTQGLARSSAAYRRSLVGGVVGGESLFLAGGLDDGWAKISAGVTFTSAGAVAGWSHAAEGPGCTQWAEGVPPANPRCLPNSNDLHVFTEAVWRDKSPASSRVLFTDVAEYTNGTLDNGGQLALHQVHIRRSSDRFATSTVARLRHCTEMTGFLQCQDPSGNVLAEPMTSAHALAVAWHDGPPLADTDVSVTAWVHQNRQNFSTSHSVRIAIGAVGESTVPMYNELREPPVDGARVQSNVAPGLACSANAANGYDCIIAVVPQTDSLGVIRVYRFEIIRDEDINRYRINQDPVSTLLTSQRTGNRIAAWYQSGRFYIAYRSLNDNQTLQIRSSADTLTWTGAGPGTVIDAGPSAVSYFTGENHLLYVR